MQQIDILLAPQEALHAPHSFATVPHPPRHSFHPFPTTRTNLRTLRVCHNKKRALKTFNKRQNSSQRHPHNQYDSTRIDTTQHDTTLCIDRYIFSQKDVVPKLYSSRLGLGNVLRSSRPRPRLRLLRI